MAEQGAFQPSPSGEADRIDVAFAALADRLHDHFRLPAGQAPGVHVVGALARLSNFGLTGFEIDTVSAGGRGMTAQDAFKSCLGEMAERLSSREAPDDPLILAPGRTWKNGGGTRIGLPPGSPGTIEPAPCEFDSIRACDIETGAEILLHCELVLHRQAAQRTAARSPGSNGVAAGSTRNAATVSALLELIERDAVALWWFGGQPARRLQMPRNGWLGFRQVMADAKRPADSRPFWLLDITTDLGVPAIACCSATPAGTSVVVGFAAHLDPEVAATKAFLEMCQMEVAQELALLKAKFRAETSLPEDDRAWIRRHNSLCVDDFPQLCGSTDASSYGAPTTTPTAGEQLPHLIGRLRNLGVRAFIVDLTRPWVGIPVVRAVAPELQSTSRDRATPRLEAAAIANGVDLAQRLLSLAPI